MRRAVKSAVMPGDQLASVLLVLGLLPKARALPAALASMYAKYTRELSMDAFNQWWEQQIPGIKATAGYPQDAKRFLENIKESLEPLDIAMDTLWRKSFQAIYGKSKPA